MYDQNLNTPNLSYISYEQKWARICEPKFAN